MTILTEKELFDRIESEIKKRQTPFTIAIDGRSASGKTTLAEKIGRTFDMNIVHADDFFLPAEMRTTARLSEPGGNFHRERFRTEVVLPLLNGSFSGYTAFRFHESTSDYISLLPERSTVIEGAYCLHPFFGRYAHMTVYYDIQPDMQLQRIIQRNGPEKAVVFKNKWIPYEEAYRTAFSVDLNADYRLIANN